MLITKNFLFQPPKKDTKGSSKQPQKTQKKKEGGSGGKAKKKVSTIENYFLVKADIVISKINVDS